MDTVPAHLRPMNLGDILDSIFQLYRNNFLTFVGVAAVIQVPIILLDLIIAVIFGQQAMADLLNIINDLPSSGNPFETPSDIPLGNMLTVVAAQIFILLIQGLILQQIMTGALVNAIARRYLDQPVSILGAYDFGVQRMVWIILAQLMVAFLIFISLFPFFGCTVLFPLLLQSETQSGLALAFVMILGVLVLSGVAILLMIAIIVMFLFVVQAIVLEAHGPVAALKRSWQLVRSSFWRTLGIAIVLFLLVMIIAGIPSIGLTSIVGIIFSAPEDFIINQTLSRIISNSISILVAPLTLIGYTLLYYDIRMRKEGYDIQLTTAEENPY